MFLTKHPLRVGLFFSVIFFFLILFTIKLSSIQIFRSGYLSDKAERQQNHTVELEPRRGGILDRNGRALALNVMVYSLYANPRAMSDADKALVAEKLSKVLGFNRSVVFEKLGKSKYFVWLARKLSADVYEKIKALKLPGTAFVKESRRFYPNGNMAAHVIGFANIDNIGLQGVEYEYDRYLRGEKGMAQVLRDARQRDLLIEKEYLPAKDGDDVVLTIDETIQFIAERALDKAVTKHNARAGTVIVMDPRTGEILAFANRPTFRPDAPDATGVESRTNRAVAFVFEPGSVFKIVTAAAALEEGAFNEEDVIFCENGKYRIANHILKDAHPHGNLTFQGVVEMSSNIGFAKIAQKLGADKVYEYGRRFRFGMRTDIGMIGEVNGMFKPVSSWSKTSIGAIPMGQEVTVTAVQLAGMIAAVANDGIYMKPHYVKMVRHQDGGVVHSFRPKMVSRVMHEKTAQRLKLILQGVIDNGTGRAVKMKDVSAGGKTGTAQKVVGGTYSHSKFVASFIGFAPVEDPKFAIIVTIDEPHPAYYGGVVAGPVFKEIVEDSLKYLSAETRSKE